MNNCRICGCDNTKKLCLHTLPPQGHSVHHLNAPCYVHDGVPYWSTIPPVKLIKTKLRYNYRSNEWDNLGLIHKIV